MVGGRGTPFSPMYFNAFKNQLVTTGFKINANGGVKLCKNKSIQNKMHLKELRYIIKPGDME